MKLFKELSFKPLDWVVIRKDFETLFDGVICSLGKTMSKIELYSLGETVVVSERYRWSKRIILLKSSGYDRYSR